jgi:hypothetical protein
LALPQVHLPSVAGAHLDADGIDHLADTLIGGVA